MSSHPPAGLLTGSNINVKEISMSLNDSNDIKNTAATHPVLKLQPGRGYKFIMFQLSLFLSKHHKKPSTDE